MKSTFLGFAVVVISACATMQSTDPSQLSFKIPKGSTLTLNKALDIPAGKTHATLQFGKVVTDRERKDYDLNCRLDVKEFGSSTVQPEVFRILRSESGQVWISQPAGLLRYYTDVFLDSEKGTDVIKLTCQQQGYAMDAPFTVSDMEATLGDYLTFTFQQFESAQ